MRGGLHWGKPSSDIHTSPTCCESATQSLSAPGTTVSRAWSRGRGGGGWVRVCGHRECHVTRGGGGARSQRLSPSPRVQVSPTRVPDSLVLPSLGAESAHGPEWGLSPRPGSGRSSGSKDWGSVRDQRQGSPKPRTADPWLLRNPPAPSRF